MEVSLAFGKGDTEISGFSCQGFQLLFPSVPFAFHEGRFGFKFAFNKRRLISKKVQL
ncbi:hypothetical protein ACTMU2_39255 [Cupriavidus basilensis]